MDGACTGALERGKLLCGTGVFFTSVFAWDLPEGLGNVSECLLRLPRDKNTGDLIKVSCFFAPDFKRIQVVYRLGVVSFYKEQWTKGERYMKRHLLIKCTIIGLAGCLFFSGCAERNVDYNIDENKGNDI